MKIYIPSYKRASERLLRGMDYFKGALYVVPDSQADDYTKVVGKRRVLAIPDEADGNIAKKRNWILENCERPLIMIDDDVSYMCAMQGRATDVGFTMFDRIEYETFLQVAQQIFDLCREWDIRYWGVAQKPDEREYKEFKPFSLTALALGPFQGHLEHPLLFDERMGPKDDYDMNLQQLQRYFKLLRVNYLAYRCEHGDNEGGIVSMRTLEYEEQYCRAIMEKWGSRIIKYKLPPTQMTDVLNGRVNVPIKGV